MPRKKRLYTEYMHIVNRGTDKQIIFIDDDDKYFYLRMLKKYKLEENIHIVAYCLMDNHVHILIQDREKHISLFMQRLNTTYSLYFNKKYNRCGHLFQNRFNGEPITDGTYFKTVFKYILLNPEKAGICPFYDYKWSTAGESGKRDPVTDFDLINQLIGNIHFAELQSDSSDYSKCIDIDNKHDDEWAMGVIQKSLGFNHGKEILELPEEERNKAVLLLLRNGLNARQIYRLTGINRKTVSKLKKQCSKI